MKKKQMIEAILLTAKSSAMAAGQIGTFDGVDMFFSLAFKTDGELKFLCKKIGISA